MAEIEPGGWSTDIPDDIYQQNGDTENTPIIPSSNADLVKIYSALDVTLQLNPAVVYYPCCERDVTPTDAFPDARVIYLDRTDSMMEMLRTAGYEAVTGDANEFTPDAPVDLLILLNPQIQPGPLLERVRIGGHVMCNNYHSTAFAIAKDVRFSAVAAGIKKNEEWMVDRDNPVDYVTHVQNDAEFSRYAPDIYAQAMQIVGETRASVLEGYAEFLSDGFTYCQTVTKNDQNYPVVPTRKHALVDDFFVFRRVS